MASEFVYILLFLSYWPDEHRILACKIISNFTMWATIYGIEEIMWRYVYIGNLFFKFQLVFLSVSLMIFGSTKL